MWEDVWVHLQGPQLSSLSSTSPLIGADTCPGSQKADVLAQVQALATDLSVDTAEWVGCTLPRMLYCP